MTKKHECLNFTLPYYFSCIARDDGQDLKIGDFVRVQGLTGKFEVIEIFPRFSSVRIERIGASDAMVFPWRYVSPYKEPLAKSNTVTKSIGNWLFRGQRVYRLSEPDRILMTKKINWDSETSDVEDDTGRLFCDVPWDDLEFYDEVDYHFPDERTVDS